MSSGERLLISKEGGESKEESASEEQMDYEDTSFSESTSQGPEDSQESQETSILTQQGNLIISDGQGENEEQDIVEDEQMEYEDAPFVEGSPAAACSVNDTSESGRVSCIAEMPRNDGVSVIANTAEAEAYLSAGVIQEVGTMESTTEVSLNSEDAQALNEVSENEEHHSLVPYSSEDSAGMDTADDETNAETEEVGINSEDKITAEVDMVAQDDENAEYETHINTEEKTNNKPDEIIEYENEINEAEPQVEENIACEASVEQDVSAETEVNSESHHLAEQQMKADAMAETELDYGPEEELVENTTGMVAAEVSEAYEDEENDTLNVYDVQEPHLVKSDERDSNTAECVVEAGDLELCSMPEDQDLSQGNEDSDALEGQDIPQENEDSGVLEGQDISQEEEDSAVLGIQERSQENDCSTIIEGDELSQENVDSVLLEGQELPQENIDSVLIEGQELRQENEESVILEGKEFTQGREDSSGQELSHENDDSGSLSIIEAGEEAVDESNEVQSSLDDNRELLEDVQDDGEGEDDVEGEEYLGEEEEFEDGEEMAEEVEVEIEDCSDPEMESEGGVTYIISEGMIVVEENESSEAYQTTENGMLLMLF